MTTTWIILIILGCMSVIISIYYLILTCIRDKKIIENLTSQEIQENTQTYIVPVTRGIPVNNLVEGIIVVDSIR